MASRVRKRTTAEIMTRIKLVVSVDSRNIRMGTRLSCAAGGGVQVQCGRHNISRSYCAVVTPRKTGRSTSWI